MEKDEKGLYGEIVVEAAPEHPFSIPELKKFALKETEMGNRILVLRFIMEDRSYSIEQACQLYNKLVPERYKFTSIPTRKELFDAIENNFYIPNDAFIYG